jgi:quercetin dioxygenase-like cupin family protein
MKSAPIIAIFALAFFNSAIAQQEKQPTGGSSGSHAIHSPDQIKWQDAPAALPAGAKIAILEGDPAKEGFFTMRLSMPDGYKIPPHTHPKIEHVTVISGTFNLGMGEKFDQNATQELPAGTFGFWPAGMKHFAWAKGATVIQAHGVGPWKIEYVNPADDPRKAKETGDQKK